MCGVISMHWCSRKYSSEILEAEIALAAEVFRPSAGSWLYVWCDYIVIQAGTGIFKGNVQSLGGYRKVACKTEQPLVSGNVSFGWLIVSQAGKLFHVSTVSGAA